MDIALDIIVFLFLVAVIASYIDVLAGGGGLLTIPALMVAGLPPLTALGTNKFQSSIGTAAAVRYLTRQGRIDWSQMRGLCIASLIGAALGTVAIQFIDSKAIELLIPIVLIIIALYTLLAPLIKVDAERPRLSHRAYQYSAVPLIGAYDGMLGPGTGSFFATAGVALRAKSLLQATAEAKALNLASNLAALIIFISLGQVAWLYGAIMIAGQLIGANLGARSLLKIRPNHLRIIIVTMSLLMLARYFYAAPS